jgi:hypothetical protein
MALFCFMTAVAMGATIYVPDDYPTIQGAIDAAVDGDEIIVRPGTYLENIDFLGKKISVTGEGRALGTVIDGSQAGSVVSFMSGETYKSILDGFTIMNGDESVGGGIRLENSNAKILHCIIKENVSTSSKAQGGGIYANNSSPFILGCMIIRNTAREAGGGIYVEGGSPIITGCTIALNEHNGATSGGGGGIHITEGSSAAVANTILWNNTALAGNEIYIGTELNPSDLDISYSDVEGGEAMIHCDLGCTYTWGAGMLDSDPLFAEAAADDFHLLYPSPCLGTGDNNATGITLKDIEDDRRIVGTAVDMGADEFCAHLYCCGDPVPGGVIAIRIVGYPGTSSVTLGQGPALNDPPSWTMHGYLYLVQPLLGYWQVGPMTQIGIKSLSATIPSGALPGDEFYFQALVGPRGGTSTVLSNPLTLTIQ